MLSKSFCYWRHLTIQQSKQLNSNLLLSSLFPQLEAQRARNFHYKRIYFKHALQLIRAFTEDNKKMHDCLPFFASGKIVHGFGRGSKELGIPTANYPLDVVKSLPEALKPGIYYGWANVDNGEVYKMVMSIGWNPYFDNKERSMETHIMHEFNCDLYDCLLKVCIVGYLRPEQNFTSLEELISAIRNDIAQADTLLDSNETSRQLKYSNFFQGIVCNEKSKQSEK